MQNSRTLKISEANNRMSKQWATVEITWSAFVERLGKPKITNESIDEFLSFPKSKQDELKDVGGFVGGELNSSLRRNSSVKSRSLITLDLDNLAYQDDVEIVKKLNSFGCAFAVYSTRKHQKTKPRIRVIIPLAVDVTAEEYEPIARKVASIIGMRYCDPTTFQAVRLMYWPSHSKDSDYVYEYADKAMLDGKAVLKMYENWRDVRQWPEVPEAAKLYQGMLKYQENPLEKDGVVGAFCRRYSILQAIDEFLPGVYEACDVEDRLTFVGGSTTAGAIIYGDGLFLYSHHATDPCSQKLVNAFDLVRLHKFGYQDVSAELATPVNKLPSWKSMIDFIGAKTPIMQDLIIERREKAINEFAMVPYVEEKVLEGEVVEDEEGWEQGLKCNANGAISPVLPNILLILRKDKMVKDKIYYEVFANRLLTRSGLPWDNNKDVRQWTDADDAGLRWFFANYYEMKGTNVIMDGLTLVSQENKENGVDLYLRSLTWDGVPRLETLFIDYLGCEDNIYTREAAKLSLVAAVRRATSINVKWDNMPILIGPQGTGKSTFLRMLGKHWFNDSLTSFDGKEACEVIQGSWIVEIGELTGLRKSEENAAKNFLSRQDDIFREAYGRRTQKFPRRCVFFGTANDSNFLRDETGNRRFWPIDTFICKTNKSIFEDLESEVDQIWAEAYRLAQDCSFKLFLSSAALDIANHEQDSHKEENVKKGIIVDYLDKKIPKNWNTMPLFARRNFLQEYEINSKTIDDLVERDKVCVLEIWEEALENDKRFIKKMDSIEISNIMNHLKGWEKIKTNARFGAYGTQKGYRKIT